MAPYDSSQVASAIDKAGPDTLRSTLKSICKKSDPFEYEVAQHLLVAATTVNSKKRKSRAGSKPIDQGANKKTKDGHDMLTTPRFETCRTCKTHFDITNNAEDACQLHPKNFELDPDVFPDDDDIKYGWVEHDYDWTTDERWEEYPEGFVYPCCGRNISEGPCVVRRHLTTREASPDVASSVLRSDDKSRRGTKKDEDKENVQPCVGKAAMWSYGPEGEVIEHDIS